MTDLAQIKSVLGTNRLCILGGFHEDRDTILMVGPDEPAGFWDHFRASPEARDQQPDALDRWSRRVLSKAATELGAGVRFPFGGPPYDPFYTWAIRTGRVHESPIKLLVHDKAGLWVSFRGALVVPATLDLPPAPPSPCDSCQAKPCLTACPAGVLDAQGYDVPGCKTFLTSAKGQKCMEFGCQARRICPVSIAWDRRPEQSAFHMEAFCPQ